MNKAHIEFLKSAYNDAVGDYCHSFCLKHGWVYNPDDWVAGKVGEVIEICDRFIDFRDIKCDIDNDFAEDMFVKWYDYTLQLHELGCTKTINYWHFANGCPLPYSEEHLVAIRVAKKRRDDAEQAFRDCLATQTDEIDFVHGKEAEE